MKTFLLLLILSIGLSPSPILAQENQDKLVNNLKEVAYNYRLEGQFEKAIEVLHHGIAIFELEPENVQPVGQLKIDLAQILLRQSFHKNEVDEQALRLYKEALKIAENKRNEKLLADALYGIGYYHFKKGAAEFDKALFELEESLDISKRLEDHFRMSKAQFIIGTIYQGRNELEQAESYYQQSILHARSIQSSYLVADNERHMGYLFYLKDDMEHALPHFLKSLELRRSIGYKDGAIFAAITLAQTLNKLEKPLEAIPYLQEALKDAIDINSAVGTVRAYTALGQIYKKMERWEEAKLYLHQTIESARLVGYSSTEEQAQEDLLEVNTALGLKQSIKEKNLTQHPGDDRYASYSPDGQQIIFESNRDGNWEIYLMAANGSQQHRLTQNEADNRRPSWHPNGKKVVFESNRSGKFELYELSIKNQKVNKITIENLQGEPVFARYSPDGQRIVFSNKISDQKSKILLIDANGQLINTIVDYGVRTHYPTWSPDGNRLLFFSRHDTNNVDDEIYQINTDRTGEKRLTNWPKNNFCPSWSHDGKKIAYVTSMDNLRPEIYIMNADGSQAIRITYNEDGETLPTWSPDDKKLLITAYREGHYEICELTLPQ